MNFGGPLLFMYFNIFCEEIEIVECSVGIFHRLIWYKIDGIYTYKCTYRSVYHLYEVPIIGLGIYVTYRLVANNSARDRRMRLLLQSVMAGKGSRHVG